MVGDVFTGIKGMNGMEGMEGILVWDGLKQDLGDYGIFGIGGLVHYPRQPSAGSGCPYEARGVRRGHGHRTPMRGITPDYTIEADSLERRIAAVVG